MHAVVSGPRPTNIVLHKASHALELSFDSGQTFRLPCELLRVYSPSAEVMGHGPGQRILQVGKRHVNIRAISPIGNYAVLLEFDDGHKTGIFSWGMLHDLGARLEQHWQSYLDQLQAAGASRDPT